MTVLAALAAELFIDDGLFRGALSRKGNILNAMNPSLEVPVHGEEVKVARGRRYIFLMRFSRSLPRDYNR